MTRFLVFDVETSGLNVKEDHLISIGWIIYDDGEVVKHVEYISNDTSFKNEAESINGITYEMREKGKDLDYILDKFCNDIYCEDIYAFNVEFDTAFLLKYDSTLFEEVNSINEISMNDHESVLNALQRIIKMTFNSFDYNINFKGKLHSAYNDVFAEMIILLHDKFNEDVSGWFKYGPFDPVITFGKYKFAKITDVCEKDKNYIKWLKTICKPHQQYILDEILKEEEINTS